MVKVIPEFLRRKIVASNRILQTDTYNRTMEYVQGKSWRTKETYILHLRIAQEGYLVVYGIREQLENFAFEPITQSELDFAKEYYAKHGNVKFFNAEKWQEIIDKHAGKLPFDVDSVLDGTVVLPGDPVLRISGPGELVAHFEPYFHRIFYPTRVATIAHEIGEKIGADRFVEVGKRGVPTEETHLIASAAMYVGGGIKLTSNDSAAACYSQLRDTGTLGHRFIQAFETEEEAFRKAIENLDFVFLLVDLNNSLKGIELALKLKKEYRQTGKKIWIRLDSGDVASQTLYALKRFKDEGFIDPVLDKIIVESIEDVEEMVEIDKRAKAAGFEPKKFVLYGAGELLVYKNTGRSFVSTGFKLSQHGNLPTMKYSDSPGKVSFPGQPTLVMVKGERMIAQVGEFPQGKDLFVPAFRKGKILLPESLDKAREQVIKSFELVKNAAKTKSKTQLSPKMRKMMNK